MDGNFGFRSSNVKNIRASRAGYLSMTENTGDIKYGGTPARHGFYFVAAFRPGFSPDGSVAQCVASYKNLAVVLARHSRGARMERQKYNKAGVDKNTICPLLVLFARAYEISIRGR